MTRNGFVNFDDEEYIIGNTHVTSGLTWTNVIWAFKTGEAANWHPLTWISHMADCDLYGLNPAGHHLTNILFHVANTLLLFLLLNRMTRRDVAQRVRGGIVRLASAARRIRGVGFGTQGCVERVFLAADAAGLCALCGKVQSPKSGLQNFLCARRCFFSRCR